MKKKKREDKVRVDFLYLKKVMDEMARGAERDQLPRSPRRIPRLLKVIERAWKKNPNLRLLQLLLNALASGDAYYVEDDMLEVRIKELYLRRKGRK